MIKLLHFRFADDVSIQDEVLGDVNNKVTPVKVMNMSNIMMQGNYQVIKINIVNIYNCCDSFMF